MANNSSPSSSSPNPTPSSPNPNPNPTPTPQSPQTEPTPRARSTSGSPHSPSPRRPRNQSVSPRPRPPVMGAPGQSAFSPYTAPRHPTPAPTGPPPPSNVGFGFPGPHPFLGAPGAVPVPVAGAGVYRIGSGMDNPVVRKRIREGTAAAGQGQISGNQQAEVGGNQFACSVCGKRYNSSRALFGHMRSHPDRGWKGAHPPPAFNAAEEFADLPRVVQTPEEGAGGDAVAVDPPVAEEGGRGQDAGQGEGAAEEPQNYRVPDLNHPAPQE